MQSLDFLVERSEFMDKVPVAIASEICLML
jgi:hypothetical protein